MDPRDIQPSAIVVNKTSKAQATILAISATGIKLSPWDTTEAVTIPLAEFTATYRTEVQPNGLPTFTIEPSYPSPEGSNFVQSVRLAPLEQDSAWVDDEMPLVLRATEAGLPALSAYVTALRMAEAWLGRECDGSGSFGDSGRAIVTMPGWSVYKTSEHSRKRYPTAWFGIAVSPSDHDEYNEMVVYPSLSVRDEALALQILEAVAAGHLKLER